MIKSNIFKDNIIKSKLLKHDVVGAVLNNIDNVHFLINKITNDYQILGTYNVETIHLSLRSLEKIKDNLDKLKVLDNPSLEKEIIDYVDEAQYICSSIYNKENELYEKKKSSEHLLLMYDRQYAKLNKEIDDERALTEIRYQFQKEINDFRSKVRALENVYSEYWKKMYKALLENDIKNKQLQDLLHDYSKKEIEAKKFYFKEFTYA